MASVHREDCFEKGAGTASTSIWCVCWTGSPFCGPLIPRLFADHHRTRDTTARRRPARDRRRNHRPRTPCATACRRPAGVRPDEEADKEEDKSRPGHIPPPVSSEMNCLKAYQVDPSRRAQERFAGGRRGDGLGQTR